MNELETVASATPDAAIPVPAEVDVVIVGAGIAGGALACSLARRGLSVVLIERLASFRDLVRGEMLSPWGVEETMRLGVDDALWAAQPTLLRRWVQWDEIYPPDEAPTIDLTRPFVSGVEGPLSISHYRTCERFAESARRAGAQVIMGASDLTVQAGARPSVSFTTAAGPAVVTARLVVGAGGRSGPLGRLLGIKMTKTARHWGGGLSIEGLDEWPDGVQAMGTEGNRMFFVFPQAHGRARLYLNFPAEDWRLRVGPNATKAFLRSFELSSLPLSDLILQSRPAGPCMTAPSLTTRVERLAIDGAVLIGDEAGSNDPVLGTGLSNALRDARMVAEILLASTDWSPGAFAPYVVERAQRMERLNWSARLVGTLSATFGPDAVERRRVAWRRMQQNPNYMVVLMVTMAGPDRVPEFAFSDFLADRLLAPQRPSVAKTPSSRRLSAADVLGTNGSGGVEVLSVKGD